MDDRKPWHVSGKVRSLAKAQINSPIEHVFAFGIDAIELNRDIYPHGCKALSSQPVLYAACDAPLVGAIVQIVSVAFELQLPIVIWLDRKIVCDAKRDNERVRVTDVQITHP